MEKILLCFENYEGVEIPAKFIEYFVMRGMKNFRSGHKAGENLLTDFDNELFERVLNGSDITEIVLKYSDGTEEKIWTEWQGSCDINDLQKNSFDDDGNMTIKIGKSFLDSGSET